MDYTQIFNFDFVDRDHERKTLESAISNPNGDNVILVTGPSGVGKTRLVKEVLPHVEDIEKVEITLLSEENQSNCLKQLLLQFQEKYMPISTFIHQHYSKLSDAIGGTVEIVDRMSIISISKVVDVLLSLGYIYISKNKENHSSAEMIYQYITNTVLSLPASKQLVIVFDNFQLCDETSLEVITQICKKSANNNRLKFIFIITDKEDEECHSRNYLIEQVPFTEIDVVGFNSSDYFLEILSGSIDMSSVSSDLMKNIYVLCQGNPQKLNRYLHNLEKKKGLNLRSDSKKAQPDCKIMEKLVVKQCDDIDWNDMTISEKILISTIAQFGIAMPVEILNKLIGYMQKNVYHFTDISKDVMKALFTLQNTDNILELYYKDDIEYVKFAHDSTLFSARKFFSFRPNYRVIHHQFYRFIQDNTAELRRYLSDFDIQYLQAYHARYALEADWETLNFQLAQRLYHEKKYIQSCEILTHIPDLSSFSSSDILQMYWCMYEAGCYPQLDLCLEEFDNEHLPTAERFQYYFLKANVKNIRMNKKDALKPLATARTFCTEAFNKLQVDHLEQQILVNISQRKKAKVIFDKITQDMNNGEQDARTKGLYIKVLRSSLEFYRGDKVQSDLTLAYSIAEELHNPIEQGYILNNMGFDLFWQGKIDEAAEKFKKAADLLEKTKPHEAAYPWINQAVCQMMKGDFPDAHRLLCKARFWCASNYADIMIKTNLMICVAQQDNFEEANEWKSTLETFAQSKDAEDICIQMKIYYNIAWIARLQKNPKLASHYEKLAFLAANQAKEDFLPYTWMKGYREEIENDARKRLGYDQYTVFEKHRFDPWLITVTHD